MLPVAPYAPATLRMIFSTTAFHYLTKVLP